jgi:hypothetical protein
VPCGLVYGYQHHGGNCCFHLQSTTATLFLRWSQVRFLRYTLMPTYLSNYMMSRSTRHIDTDLPTNHPPEFGAGMVDCVWNAMAHAQKQDFVFRRNGQVHLNRRGRQFSRLLAAKVCASAVVMLDTPCSEVVWTVLATHSIRQFPLHFPSRASPCAITFQLDSNYNTTMIIY